MVIAPLQRNFSLDQERLELLKQIVPEAVADSKINWETLKEALGEYLEEDEPGAEHFGLTWAGKKEARRLASLPSKGTLVPLRGEGISEEETENFFVEGDNLEVLKLLQKSYSGQIKMIYIDPPYNTGNDFIYKDKFKDSLEDYLRKTGQVDEDGKPLTSNPRTSGKFHSNWLNMMFSRLRLARNLLRDDGVIFVSIDNNEVHNLRLIMDEIFGEENFISCICVISNWKGRSDDNYIAMAHEYLLMYQRGSFKTLGLPLPSEYLKDYPEKDKVGQPYRLLGLRKRGSASRREDRPKMFYPFYINPNDKTVSLVKSDLYSIEVVPHLSDGNYGRWRWGRETSETRIQELTARKVAGTERWDVFQIDYALKGDELRRIKPKSVWVDKEFSNEAGTLKYKALMPEIVFQNPKSPKLIKQCLIQATSGDDIVLDFFAGSCTTAQAVIELNLEDGGNRKFILVQIPDACDDPKFRSIAEVGKERIRRSITKISKDSKSLTSELEESKDLGFRVLKLARSNFKRWATYEGKDIQELQTLFSSFESPFVSDWQEEAVVTEILIMEGFPLNSKVSRQEKNNNRFLIVESDFIEHKLCICLDEEITLESIRQLQPLEGVLICLDSALTDQTKMQIADVCNIKTI